VTPIRVTFVLTHPIQYYAPWFRHITRDEPELALTAIHAIDPTPAQQGTGFEQAFRWDVPLTEGYRSIIVRVARSTDRIDAASFFGLDVKEIGRVLARTEPHVVVVTGWYSVTLARAIAAARRLGVPVLYRGDTNLLSGPTGWRRAFWSARSRFLLRLFDGALSPGLRTRTFLRRFGLPDYRIFDVPHGVDNAFFEAAAKPFQSPDARADVRRELQIGPDAFVPLFVGKLVPSKRPLDVVRACAALGPGVTLLMVGAGPLESAVRVEASALGVDLRLSGFLNQRELGPAYAAADCLTLPSDGQETWGLVVNEGLATGLPAVVSDAVGCAPDLVHDGVTGYTFPLGDVDALAGRLKQMRLSRGHDWATACRETAKRHDVDAMTRGLTRACRSVLRHSVQPEPDWASTHRILACCGQMVLDGGLERMTFHAIRAAVASGASAHCIVNSWENFRITPMAESAGATWSTGPYWYPLTRRRLTPVVVLRMMLEVLRVSAHTLGEAGRIRPTHVFLPDFQTILRNAPALLWLRLRGARVVARLGNAPEPGSFNARLWRWAIAPFVDLFVCNSAFTERELLMHGVDAAKVRIIRNVLAPRRDPWLPDVERIPGRIVFVGQVIPEKGLHLLLEAVALLRTRRVNATLDVVGDMEGWEAPANAGYRAGLRARAAQSDLDGAVRFLGHRDDVPRIMAAASVHCCPSLPKQREAFGNVVLEAKCSALPSVVTPSGELPDLVEHGQTGWVCRETSAEAIAEGLEFFLGSPGRLSAAAAAARRSSEAFGQERFERAWSEVFA
jgi:glycosyltransferase involved in cell wall biosynthesis